MGRFGSQATTALFVLAGFATMMSPVRSGIADERNAPPRDLVGAVLDEQDHRLAVHAAQRALETAPNGTKVAWNNPANGHTGSIAPTRTYEALGGGYCREYESAAAIDGRVERATGVACRVSDGSWRPLTDR
jgi:surface antigen